MRHSAGLIDTFCQHIPRIGVSSVKLSFPRILGVLLTMAMFAAGSARAEDQSTSAAPKNPLDAFETNVYAASDGKSLNFRQLNPIKVEEGKKYPLVIFLHGAGERGDDNQVQLKHGMDKFASPAVREKYPCYVIAPQCPAGEQWVNVPWSADKHKNPEKPSGAMGRVFEVVDAYVKNLPVDADRIYITGLSMGGYGTWDAIARRPNFFAAAIPICGGGDSSDVSAYKSLPIWAFHGDKDTAVKVERSRDMIAALKKAGGDPKYTEYPGVGHNSWTETYNNDDVIAWLFAQKREAKKQ